MRRFKSKVLLVCVLALLLGTAQVSNGAPPPNDDRRNAKTVGNETEVFDTTEATIDGPELCMKSRNIWYCYTATCTGAATVSLCGSSFDTRIAIYNNGCSSTPTLSNMVRCNDDFCGMQSEVTFPVTSGNKYLIEVAGFNRNAFGEGLMNITCDGEANPPSNDNWFNALPVGNVTDWEFDTTVATFDGPGICMTTPNIWYCYTATSPYTCNVTVSLCFSGFDTMLAIYDGCAITPTLNNLIECNDDACGYKSEITFVATPGHQYLIEVGGYDTNETSGQGILNISSDCNEPPVGLNDDCINAIPIGNVTNLPFDTGSATRDGPGHCMTSQNIWYRYTASSTGNVTVSLCGSKYDTKLAIYNGGDCDPAPGKMIECNDDCCRLQSKITFGGIARNQ
ncbi:MAG: hypothetical protein IIB69_14715, partial [Proteobacteria bacterium]|nr:hypothetical protein [Pseudomonadota bacterium]